MLSLALTSAITLAQPIGERVRTLVDDLDAPAWLDRDMASAELSGLDETITLPDLELALRDPTLTIEQRTRLLSACFARFIDHPKGALGVSFGTIRIGAIEVQPVRDDPRFPASAMLNPGDQIAMVGEHVLEGSGELRAHIVSREPGATLPVTLLRGGQLLEIDLPLGSYSELTGAARVEPSLILDALALRWARLGISVPEPDVVGEALSIDDWRDAAFPDGAEPDPRSPDRRLPSAMLPGAQARVQTGYGLYSPQSKPWEAGEELNENASSNQIKLMQLRLQRLVARRLLFERQRQQLREQLEATHGEQRQALVARTDEITARLDAISAQIESLRQAGALIPTAPAP